MFEKIADFVQSILHLLKFWVVIHPYEQGVLLRLGTHTGLLEPGFHFVCPLGVHEVLVEHVQPRPLEVRVASHTADDVQVEISVVIVWSVDDLATFLLENDHEHAPNASAKAVVGRYVRSVPWAALHDPASTENLLCELTEAFSDLGLDVRSAEVSDLAKVRTLRLRGLAP